MQIQLLFLLVACCCRKRCRTLFLHHVSVRLIYREAPLQRSVRLNLMEQQRRQQLIKPLLVRKPRLLAEIGKDSCKLFSVCLTDKSGARGIGLNHALIDQIHLFLPDSHVFKEHTKSLVLLLVELLG